ncbi:MAG: response regulator [Anaerolineae bacterium]|nr:response regulator [Anaerolineae bacterium]
MPKRILVVDDDAGIRAALKLRLERDSLVVRTAVDGDEALRRVAEERPDLIILDLTLPRRDGLDVLAELKNSADTASIPVVILTGRYRCKEEWPGSLSASVEVIGKPFSPRYLAERVRSLLAAQPPARARTAAGAE